MQIRYILIYFIHHFRTGPVHIFKLFSSWICIPHQPHKVTSGQITVTVSYEQKAGSLLYTEHNQQQTSQPKQSIISTYHYLQLQKIFPDRFPVTHSVQNERTIDQITDMSKSPFWGTVTHVLVPIYILQTLNMRTCLNQLTMSSVTYFILQANTGIRFSQD